MPGFMFLFCSAVCLGQIQAEEGFEPLFDGKTLKGWSGKDGLWG